ncbi:hypothetical protein GCM10007977_029840 [Dactylosporangium sucinum]|uniref:Uncharacterized protein n=1 Tax=Dactylosporangium sucinum TaxID=1424081 RepID=A0A917TKQ6_9ACTN|nr:hypothetical protein GCM10007977_029840 [Dactylosporangium sucinum]
MSVRITHEPDTSTFNCTVRRTKLGICCGYPRRIAGRGSFRHRDIGGEAMPAATHQTPPAPPARRSWTPPRVECLETRPEITAYSGANDPWPTSTR